MYKKYMFIIEEYGNIAINEKTISICFNEAKYESFTSIDIVQDQCFKLNHFAKDYNDSKICKYCEKEIKNQKIHNEQVKVIKNPKEKFKVQNHNNIMMQVNKNNENRNSSQNKDKYCGESLYNAVLSVKGTVGPLCVKTFFKHNLLSSFYASNNITIANLLIKFVSKKQVNYMFVFFWFVLFSVMSYFGQCAFSTCFCLHNAMSSFLNKKMIICAQIIYFLFVSLLIERNLKIFKFCLKFELNKWVQKQKGVKFLNKHNQKRK
ncbi:hypothetical protein RFI_25423 [Reticulomyxa filosa]|uniref:Uncharacterized protein n=1 Tax=Reticulomyxa filosa TaxID=46433 RepID=X6MD67_RETFI|nr:hypothetical protein RFI_25423 [Reticulomyxa filosa]|eukprot:ETO11953.1 hypothetical protein RFI_25423 [Reticulomyxa filosa]